MALDFRQTEEIIDVTTGTSFQNIENVILKFVKKDKQGNVIRKARRPWAALFSETNQPKSFHRPEESLGIRST